ncbi:MAG: MBL fold metallo-hydrolase [Deltaproteobacteria bacterium]|nr:MBL fold metallo-hydrolase [Deltaproteobacteria bacterium]
MIQKRNGKWIQILVLLTATLLLPSQGESYCHEIEVTQRPLMRVAMGGGNPVTIQWFGHATFQITSSKGTRILTDPHLRDDLPWPTLPQHVVTTSHNHGPHSNVWMAKGDPVVLEGLTFQDNWRRIHRIVKDVAIYNVPAYHDKSHGLQRGKNSIFVYRVDDICIAHLGDLGHILTPAQLKMLGKIDILLVPVAGGRYTVTPEEANKITKLVKPRIAIPMHYWWEGAVEEFTQGNLPVRTIKGSTFRIAKKDLPKTTHIFVLGWGED